MFPHNSMSLFYQFGVLRLYVQGWVVVFSPAFTYFYWPVLHYWASHSLHELSSITILQYLLMPFRMRILSVLTSGLKRFSSELTLLWSNINTSLGIACVPSSWGGSLYLVRPFLPFKMPCDLLLVAGCAVSSPRNSGKALFDARFSVCPAES